MHILVKVQEAYSWMMFIVLELNQLLLAVDTQLIVTADTLRMLESGVLVLVHVSIRHYVMFMYIYVSVQSL